MHADGAGLYLNISLSGTKSWRLIYRFAGKRTELGLGTPAGTTLAQARDKASQAKALVRDGIDPKQARKGVAASTDKLSMHKTKNETIARMLRGSALLQHMARCSRMSLE